MTSQKRRVLCFKILKRLLSKLSMDRVCTYCQSVKRGGPFGFINQGVRLGGAIGIREVIMLTTKPLANKQGIYVYEKS